jgi:uncharacterized protein
MSAGPPSKRPHALCAAGLVVLGVLIGAWSAMCGIGGGVFAVPVLHYVVRLPLKVAIGSSLLLVAGSTTSATLVELAQSDSALHLGIAATLIAASVVGARVGFLVSRRLDALSLKALFVILFVAVATQLLLSEAGASIHTSGRAAQAVALEPSGYLGVAAIGLAAGFVAPLLGIGGGLVAVPALLYGVPALGYLGARAASMAMSVVTSWQSVWLYRREKEVAFAWALWLALGAVAGGWIGVELVHRPRVVAVARMLLVITLLAVAVRLALDVRRGWRERGGAHGRAA